MQWNAAYSLLLSQRVMSKTVWLRKHAHLQHLQKIWRQTAIRENVWGKGLTCATFVQRYTLSCEERTHSFSTTNPGVTVQASDL